jgi:hypothetical protein
METERYFYLLSIYMIKKNKEQKIDDIIDRIHSIIQKMINN